MSPRRSTAPRRRLAALVPALVAAALLGGCGGSSDAGSARGGGAGAAETGRQVPVPTPSEHLGAPGAHGVYDDSPGWKK